MTGYVGSEDSGLVESHFPMLLRLLRPNTLVDDYLIGDCA